MWRKRKSDYKKFNYQTLKQSVFINLGNSVVKITQRHRKFQFIWINKIKEDKMNFQAPIKQHSNVKIRIIQNRDQLIRNEEIPLYQKMYDHQLWEDIKPPTLSIDYSQNKRIKINQGYDDFLETVQELPERNQKNCTFSWSIDKDERYVSLKMQQIKYDDIQILKAHYGLDQMTNQKWLIPVAFYKDCFIQLKYKHRDDKFEKDYSLTEYMQIYKTKMIRKLEVNAISLQAYSMRKDLYQQLHRDQKFCIQEGIKFQGRLLINDDIGLGKTLSSLSLLSIFNFSWPVLVICNKKQKIQWANQFQKVLNIPQNQIQIIDGFQNYLQNVQVTIISYKLCSTFEESLIKRGYQICLIDGCEKLTKKELQCTMSCNLIVNQCKFKIFLSGNLNENEQQEFARNQNLNGIFQFPQLSQQKNLRRIKEEINELNNQDSNLQKILRFVKDQLEKYNKFVFFAIQPNVFKEVKILAKSKKVKFVEINRKQTNEQNQIALNEFEQDKSNRIAIVNYKVANQNLKLRASQIVFGEIWDNPYGMIQTESWIKPIDQNQGISCHYIIYGEQDEEIYQNINQKKNYVMEEELINDKSRNIKQYQIHNQKVNQIIKIAGENQKYNKKQEQSKKQRKMEKSDFKLNQKQQSFYSFQIQ